jgi:hypothetical protein
MAIHFFSRVINVMCKLDEIQASFWILVIVVCLSVLGFKNSHLEICHFFSDPLININCHV